MNLNKSLSFLFFIALTCILIVPDAAFSQRQSGSVRSVNRSGSGGSWSGTRTTGATQRSYSGNTASRDTTMQTRSGQTVSGSKDVSKSGDTVTVGKSAQSSSGASRSSSKEYEFDDGHLDSVERQSSATNRYGQSAEYQGKAQREGYGWSFEGEGTNRYGQKTEVEGYGARGPYGTGVVADVEGGRYGDRTVVAAKPYGGPTWTTSLPNGARPYNYHGYSYYHYGGAYYRPYYRGGTYYYCYVPPPYGAYYYEPPVGAILITAAAVSMLYAEGTYYQSSTTSQGSTTYVVVAPPAGTSLPGTALPADRATVTISGTTYYFYGNTFYKRVVTDGKESFVVITRPAGVITVKALPPEFEPVQAGTLNYFKTEDRYYLTYLDPSGEELYVVVDPPAAQPKATTSETTQASKQARPPTQAPSAPPTKQAPAETKASPPAPATSQPATPAPETATPQVVNLTVTPGTAITVRITRDVYAASSGQYFKANLAQDIIVDGRLVVPKASGAIGTISVSQESMILLLTDLDVAGRLYPIHTAPVQSPKSVQSASSLDAVVDPGKSSTTPVELAAGTAVEFRVTQPFTVSVLVSTPAVADAKSSKR
jgi:hypothetical protein